VQLEPETDAVISDQKQNQLEEDFRAVTEIEQRLLDGYLLTDNTRNMDTWVASTSQSYLRVLAHLQNIAARESSAMPVAGIISVKECDALIRVCVRHLSLLS
jgi:hypothetical protein